MNKQKIYRVLNILFLVLAVVGLIYILTSKDNVSAGYAVVPCLFSSIFSQLALKEQNSKSKKID